MCYLEGYKKNWEMLIKEYRIGVGNSGALSHSKMKIDKDNILYTSKSWDRV
jgi:hypothetical protein